MDSDDRGRGTEIFTSIIRSTCVLTHQTPKDLGASGSHATAVVSPPASKVKRSGLRVIVSRWCLGLRAHGRDVHPGPAAGEVHTPLAHLRRAGRAGHAHRDQVDPPMGRPFLDGLSGPAALEGTNRPTGRPAARPPGQQCCCQTSSGRSTPSSRPMTRPTCTNSRGGYQLPFSRLTLGTSWQQEGQCADISFLAVQVDVERPVHRRLGSTRSCTTTSCSTSAWRARTATTRPLGRTVYSVA